MLRAHAVRRGDRVAIVAPASPFHRDAFERGVCELQRLGFEPVFGLGVFDRRGYVAGEPRARAAALEAALQDDSVAAVMVARGGYGSAQLLPWLDRDLVTRSRKALVGYSDITSLLSFVSLQCGVVSFYGPSVAGCLGQGESAYDPDTFIRALTRPSPLGPVQASGLEPLKRGEAAGPLCGGTLTQLVSSLGTPFAFDPPPGFVLLVDETGERPYRLDRMLTQLSQSGILGRACAVVFNELPNCDEPGGRPTARDTIADVLRDFPGPILFGLKVGHASGGAVTLPLGVRARVVATAVPALIVEEAAVEP